ncbi:MAG: hypothetical protein ACI4NV_00890, partial [Thermoguttaceae bacterium]
REPGVDKHFLRHKKYSRRKKVEGDANGASSRSLPRVDAARASIVARPSVVKQFRPRALPFNADWASDFPRERGRS